MKRHLVTENILQLPLIRKTQQFGLYPSNGLDKMKERGAQHKTMLAISGGVFCDDDDNSWYTTKG